MSSFDASDSVLGFAYQERQALLIAVRRADESPAHELTIETLDDVALVSENGTTVWQVKNTATPITNASTDLWKTIRIWCENVATGLLLADDTTFVLLAASSAPDGSAAAYLRDNAERNVAKAIDLLEVTAETSKNEILGPAFRAFGALSQLKKTELFTNVFVADGSPDIATVRNQISYEIRHAVDKPRRDAFLDRLEGWWHNTVIQLLLKDDRRSIPLGLVGSQIQTLRRELEQSSLPIDFANVLPTDEETAGFMAKTFVRQMEIVGLNNSVIFAIVDYYRAGLQRNRWIGDALLYTEQLDDFAVRLREEWRSQCAAMLDDLGPESAEEERQQMGRDLYKWMRERSEERIVPECSAPFIRRGSYQILSDAKEIGWHPDFEERLAESVVEALS